MTCRHINPTYRKRLVCSMDCAVAKSYSPSENQLPIILWLIFPIQNPPPASAVSLLNPPIPSYRSQSA
jgi:hypothetical protein